MSRWIDADALIRDLQERYCRPCKASGLDYNGVKCKSCQFDDEIDDIDGFADNSIDIVSCKECKWADKCSQNVAILETYDMYEKLDFCSYGERKESDDA